MEQAYLIPVGDTISTAWEKVKGSKGSVWAALGIFFLIMIGFGILQAITKPTPILMNAIMVIGQVIQYLLQMGLIYIGIKRAFELPVSYQLMFRTFESDVTLRIIGLYLLEMLIFIPFGIIGVIGYLIGISSIPFGGLICFLLIILAVLGTIYVSIRISLSAALVLDRKLNPWSAIKKSFEATRSNFWRLIGILIIQVLILILSIIPLGVGLIWSLPFILVCYGVIYKNLSINISSP